VQTHDSIGARTRGVSSPLGVRRLGNQRYPDGKFTPSRVEPAPGTSTVFTEALPCFGSREDLVVTSGRRAAACSLLEGPAGTHRTAAVASESR
jgi:hypothetical protein